VHRNMEGDSRLCNRSIPMSSGCIVLPSARPSPRSPRQATNLGALVGETKFFVRQEFNQLREDGAASVHAPLFRHRREKGKRT
jgi:hypothetical protein